MKNNEKQFREQFIGDFVSYMRDCGLTPEEAHSYSYVVYALAASYRPFPNFWRKLNTDIVVEAVNAYTSREPVEMSAEPAEHAEWEQDIADHLFMNQHDERNAELLARMAAADRPKDAWSATEWILEELKRQGDIENLEYAERDDYKCGRAALGHLARLEAAANGKAAMTNDARLAQDFRKRAMANDSRRPTKDIELNSNNFFRVFPDGTIEPILPGSDHE